VREYLYYLARLRGLTRASSEASVSAAMDKTGLRQVIDEPAGELSHGYRKRLGIAQAIVHAPKLVILDEPTSGLDPKGAREFLALLRKLRSDGKTIFMTTHDIFRARQIADRVGIMSYGRLVGEMARPELEGVDLEEIYVKYVEEHR